MDIQDKIEELVSENELLQLQLDDLRNELKRKDNEIHILGDTMDTAASLQSRIDNNLIEIEQLRYNLDQAAQKTAGVEMMNEELELDLMRSIKEKQQKEAVIKGLGSVKTELDIITGELEESAPLYKTVSDLEGQLAEANSRIALLQLENEELKAATEELQTLINMLKKQKLD